jgi:hypothetical protein
MSKLTYTPNGDVEDLDHPARASSDQSSGTPQTDAAIWIARIPEAGWEKEVVNADISRAIEIQSRGHLEVTARQAMLLEEQSTKICNLEIERDRLREQLEELRKMHTQMCELSGNRGEQVKKLREALERTLNWLSSYPGEGAMGAYEQARAALKED